MTVDSLLTLGAMHHTSTIMRNSQNKGTSLQRTGEKKMLVTYSKPKHCKSCKKTKKNISFLKLTDDDPVLDPSVMFLLVLVDDSCETGVRGVEGGDDGQEKAQHGVTEQQHYGN